MELGKAKPCCKSSCACCVMLGAQIKDLVEQNTKLRETLKIGIEQGLETHKELREIFERIERRLYVDAR